MNCISPIDGRYQTITKPLSRFFSEYSFFKYRLFVELRYFIHLTETLPELKKINVSMIKIEIMKIWENYSKNDFEMIKKYEGVLNHDIKALEYFIRDRFNNLGLMKYSSFIHFAITSQDINTSANILALKDAINHCLVREIEKITLYLDHFIQDTQYITMLGFTHGQPAVPTTMGKEMGVFRYRLQKQLDILKSMPYSTKFGGAVGNFNAHYAAYPEIDWIKFTDRMISDIGLKREKHTTQISNYDDLCNIFNQLKTINCIVNDLNIDCWLYISKGYLKLKTVSEEIGSSTMPQKVNPIHFENSEGNVCIANAMIEGITRKISISRLQRDLTDSTILRNIGTVLGYSMISYSSTQKGLQKISVNKEVIDRELSENLAVLAEPIQTILRKHGEQDAYEKLHKLTRDMKINQHLLDEFIKTLPEKAVDEIKKITVNNYTGNVNCYVHSELDK